MIHHIELYVSDLDKTSQFWGWFLEELGYNLFQEWNKGRSWKYKDFYIVFVQVEARFSDVPYHRCRVGLNHLAFHASSRQFVDEMKQKLQEKGIDVLYKEKYPYAGGENHYALYFEDPDRIKVELVAK
ncbi:VOC family protein [Aquibacillus koreensis]|uniref:VOC family protein n=1 Tax=Aquibacillus koreensis TaxID=279446 RepID=A0A9X4AKF3_9BACI|nr:VOC family protein [Aquibacillus koreensis]MCT2535257.1 VOC family protein [Aquibacillus koreensis]MDC3422784.1 VOC family protein [Aquibacillus koreensis]